MVRNWLDMPVGYWRSPFDELSRIKAQLDRFYGGEGQAGATPSAQVFPLVNITEDKDNYYIRGELPGIATEDLDLSVTGKTLTLSGERKIASPDGVSYHRRERRAGSFSRTITLPVEIASEKVAASLADGVLTITLPKADEVKPRQVRIKAG